MTSNDAVVPEADRSSELQTATIARRQRSFGGRIVTRSAAVGLASLALSGVASASGFLNPRLADPHGHPALANPYAIYFNPAALGGIHGTQIVVDGTLAWRTVDVSRVASALSPQSPATTSDPTYTAANTGDAHASNVVTLPFIAASSDFGTRNFFAGVGLYVPYGGATKFDSRSQYAGNSEVRGAVDGPQRWSLISGIQQGIFSTAAIGFRLPDERISFALSGSLVMSSVLQYQARNLAGNDDITTEGRALIDVSGVEASATAGIYWEALPKQKLRLGVSYNVRPGFGEVRLAGSLKQQYATTTFNKDIDLLLTYPDVIRAGLATRPWGDAVELRLDAEYVTWSAFKRQCIVVRGAPCNIAPDGSEIGSGQILINLNRKWRDAGAVRAGLGYFLDEQTEIYGALGVDTSAVSKATLDSTYPDTFKLMGSIGARHQFGSAVTLGASYTYVAYLATTTGSQSQYANAGASRIPNEDGTYSSQLMFFNLNAAFAF